MDITPVKKSESSAQAEEAQKNRLGISRGIYATGYSVKDAFIWGTAATLAVFGVVTFGSKKFAAIRTLEQKLIEGHNWWKAQTGKWLKEGVGSVAVIAGFLVGHIVQIPSATIGWRKAQAAVDKHNKLYEEKDQLVEVNALLADDNKLLKAALIKAEKNRPSLAERALAAPAEASANRSI